MSAGRSRMTYRLRRGDGVYREILDNGAPFYRGEAFAGYFGSCIDVTDQQAAEAQLRQVAEDRRDRQADRRRGARLQQSAAGDWRQSGDARRVDMAGNGKHKPGAQTALEAGGRAARSWHPSCSLSAGVNHCPESVQPRAPYSRSRRHAAPRDRRRHRDRRSCRRGLWNTLVDAVQVETALLNLAINARDAMDGQGKLTIEAGNASLDDKYATRHAGGDSRPVRDGRGLR